MIMEKLFAFIALRRDMLSIDPKALLPFSCTVLGKTRLLPCAVGGLSQLVLPGGPGRMISPWRLTKVSAVHLLSLAEFWFAAWRKSPFFQPGKYLLSCVFDLR